MDAPDKESKTDAMWISSTGKAPYSKDKMGLDNAVIPNAQGRAITIVSLMAELKLWLSFCLSQPTYALVTAGKAETATPLESAMGRPSMELTGPVHKPYSSVALPTSNRFTTITESITCDICMAMPPSATGTASTNICADNGLQSCLCNRTRGVCLRLTRYTPSMMDKEQNSETVMAKTAPITAFCTSGIKWMAHVSPTANLTICSITVVTPLGVMFMLPWK